MSTVTEVSQVNVANTADVFAVPQTNVEESSGAPNIRIVGQTKWFNDEKGYGFLRSITPDGPDVFVHIRDIQAKHTHNPTLYTGEYVEFGTAPNGTATDGTERLKATCVTGIEGGTLMCDHGSIMFRSYTRVGFGNAEDDAKDDAN